MNRAPPWIIALCLIGAVLVGAIAQAYVRGML